MNVLIFSTLIIVCITIIKCQKHDDGQYHPDDEGRYIHDDSGRYFPDNSGQYRDDGTGRYSGEEKYRQINTRFRDQGSIYSSPRPFSLSAPIRSRSVKSKPNTIPIKPSGLTTYDDGKWKVIRLSSDVNKAGFHWEYETENNIIGEERAHIHNEGSKDEIIRAKGFYKYTGPDNVEYNVEYTADENGFIPTGKHLPLALQAAINQNVNRKNS